MYAIRQRLIGWMVAWSLPLLSVAQSSFEAITDVSRVSLQSYFNVSFVLRNADEDVFTPPAFQDFDVVNRPSKSFIANVTNGKAVKEITYTYTLRPKRTGKLTIESASMKTPDKTFRTRPILIEVTAATNADKAQSARRIFLRAEPLTTRAFLGQQILVDYKLYTNVGVETFMVAAESDYPGFFAEPIRRYNPPAQRETINGITYISKVIKRVALFPQQTGALTIRPLQVELSLPLEEESNANTRNNFFFGRPTERLMVASEDVRINVRPLPPDAPDTFTGAVGNFNASFLPSRTELSTDDVLALRLTIVGDSDIKRVQPPALTLPAGLEGYDPKVLEESVTENGDGVLISKKVIEYLILPKAPGNYSLEPRFTYFDPTRNVYVATEQKNIALQVKPGSVQAPTTTADESDSIRAKADIRFLKTSTQLQQSKRHLIGSPLMRILMALPVCLLLGLFVLQGIRRRKGMHPDAAALRTRYAKQEAVRHLQAAEKHLRTGASRAFFDEVSKALLGYVCDKLRIPRSALTKDTVREKLQELQAPAALVDEFMQIIQICEVALFSGQQGDDATMQNVYRKAFDNIAALETQLSSR